MNEEKIEEISIQIRELIEDEISKQDTNQEYKERFEDFNSNFEYMVQDARDVVEDYKSQGLTFNTIEAEGYLRAFLTIQSILPIID